MKNINRIFLLIFCFNCFFNTMAQNTDSGDVKFTNLFKCGEQLTSPEINFKNLFHNFPIFIKNANEVDLLSYEYFGVVKSRKQVFKLLKNNIYPHAPAWGTMSISGGNGDESIGLKQPTIILDTSTTLDSDKKYLNEIRHTIANEYVQIGYHIYVLKFVFRLKTYKYYIFVNPEDKQVVTEGNIFGFNIPVE